MKISYFYRSTQLVKFGFSCIVLFTLVFFAFLIAIINEISLNDEVIIISIFTIEPIIIVYGVYNIIKGIYRYKLEFNEKTFHLFRNEKLKITLSIGNINKIIATHGSVISMHGGFNYKKIEIDSQEKDNIQFYIRGKKWRSDFDKFLESLKQFCEEMQIQFDIVEK